MDPGTGRIHHFAGQAEEALRAIKERGFVEVPQEKLQPLKKASIARRKGWMRNQPCPCGSARKFKVCCWHKYA